MLHSLMRLQKIDMMHSLMSLHSKRLHCILDVSQISLRLTLLFLYVLKLNFSLFTFHFPNKAFLSNNLLTLVFAFLLHISSECPCNK